jgi:hypothetical protein
MPSRLRAVPRRSSHARMLSTSSGEDTQA